MAQKIVTYLVSDLSGKDVDPSGETVTFALDGEAYEIDLSEKEAKALRSALEPYIQSGRRLARNGRPYRSTTVPQVKRRKS